MPDNRLGEDQAIPTPRDQGFSGNDDFGVMRALDGRRAPEDQVSPDPDLVRNIHTPTGPDAPENDLSGDLGITLLEVVLILAAIALVILILRWL